jgi:hypothetical protein
MTMLVVENELLNPRKISFLSAQVGALNAYLVAEQHQGADF